VADIGQVLSEHTRLGLDTAVFIYHLEQHPRYSAVTHPLLSGVESGRWTACTSVITLMELTVRPWQMDQPEVAWRYESALACFPNLSVMEVTREVAREAARLRAAYRLRPADAIQVGTAIVDRATAWVTNDRGLVRLAPVIAVFVLDDLV
jgi:predicted nucleic acid-binding protein